MTKTHSWNSISYDILSAMSLYCVFLSTVEIKYYQFGYPQSGIIYYNENTVYNIEILFKSDPIII